MEFKTLENYAELSEFTAKEIIEQIKQKPSTVLCLPSGDSPKGVFKILIDYAKSNPDFFSSATFVGLDEWVGMDKNDDGSCQYYIYNEVLKHINFKEVIEFNAKATDLNAECAKMDKVIEDLGGIDYMLLGVGMNGHLGLNEPMCSFENKSWVSELSETTKVVAQKYFDSETVLEKGITLGIKSILETKNVVVIASGEKKKPIIEKLKESEVDSNIPITALKLHNNSRIYTDF